LQGSGAASPTLQLTGTEADFSKTSKNLQLLRPALSGIALEASACGTFLLRPSIERPDNHT
jgi:hypothetical protein